MLDIKGKNYAQTEAIMTLLGKLHGYYPEDPYEGWEVDSNIQTTYDLLE